MRSTNLIPAISLLQLAAAKGVAGVVSGATLFTGPAAPVVDLGYAKYQGKQDDTTKSSNYLGLKYANAPRFDHSTVHEGSGASSDEVVDASDYGPACPQHELTSVLAPDDLGLGGVLSLVEAAPILQSVLKQSEDCLSINVQRPQDEDLTDLPVVLWIHGGGFEAGASSSISSETSAVPGVFYQGANLVKRSLDMGQPIIVASINYRLAHFGFTASKEFEEAGLLNVGLEDQRNAMHWVQKNIVKFGGDPKKVTIMGESAGSWSVSAHMLANGGDSEGLFSAAIGLSGGPIKVEGPSRQQDMFDDLIDYVGCGGSSDKIACLRKAPYEKIYAHQGTISNYIGGYAAAASPWTLRPSSNNSLVPQSPDILAASGNIANIPLLMGDMKDEGTLFALRAGLNTTTDAEVKEYFKSSWWPSATDAQLDRLLELYPGGQAGSPYDSGPVNSLLGPQFKRLASIIGDYSFESQRRQFFANHKGPIYTYQTEVTLPLSILNGNSNNDNNNNNKRGLLGSVKGLVGSTVGAVDKLASSTGAKKLIKDSPIVTAVGNLVDWTGLTEIPIVGSVHAFDAIFYLFGTLPASLSSNSRNIMTTIVSFVNHHDPNHHDLEIPQWPRYDRGSKKMYVFRENGPKVIEDTYRDEAMAFFNDNGDVFRI